MSEFFMIENPEFLAGVRKGIKDVGVFLLAISDSVPCCECGHSNCNEHAEATQYDKPEDGFVYSIGHRERNRPDFVIFCGPAPQENAFSRESLNQQMFEAAQLINYLVQNWDKKPVRPGEHCGTRDGRLYQVLDNPDLIKLAKSEFMVQAGNYYGNDDYGVLALIPVGWQHNA